MAQWLAVLFSVPASFYSSFWELIFRWGPHTAPDSLRSLRIVSGPTWRPSENSAESAATSLSCQFSRGRQHKWIWRNNEITHRFKQTRFVFFLRSTVFLPRFYVRFLYTRAPFYSQFCFCHFFPPSQIFFFIDFDQPLNCRLILTHCFARLFLLFPLQRTFSELSNS